MKKVFISFVLPLLFLIAPLCASSATDDGAVFEAPFRKAVLDGWSWIREVPDHWRILDKGMEIKMEPIPEEGVRNILFRKVPKKADGPFVVTVEVKALQPYTNQYQQTGLYWMQGDELKFKFVLERIDGDLYVFPGKKPVKTEHVVLRLRIDGTKIVAEYQEEATGEFQNAVETQLPDRNDETDRISLQCWHGPPGTESWVRFQRFSIDKPK